MGHAPRRRARGGRAQPKGTAQAEPRRADAGPGPMFVGTVGELTSRLLTQTLAELDVAALADEAARSVCAPGEEPSGRSIAVAHQACAMMTERLAEAFREGR